MPARDTYPGTQETAQEQAGNGKGHDRSAGPMVALAGGTFTMGNHARYGIAEDGESPAHEVAISPFSISAHAITNERFARFVDATDYRTDAERYGWSFVFGALLPSDFPPTQGVAAAPWWRRVEGADWAHPEGPHSSWEPRPDHPTVHVSWNDARAFCDWAGGRLPTEAEWELAARGGLEEQPFPWGDALEPGGEHLMNVFQGSFPSHNTCADGYAGTAPVGSFPENGFGLYEMTGNVWEWTNDRFDPRYYAWSPRTDPQGPERGNLRVQRGGSYLCHASYCNRYRVDARSSNSPDSSTGNLGFRVARDVPGSSRPEPDGA